MDDMRSVTISLFVGLIKDVSIILAALFIILAYFNGWG